MSDEEKQFHFNRFYLTIFLIALGYGLFGLFFNWMISYGGYRSDQRGGNYYELSAIYYRDNWMVFAFPERMFLGRGLSPGPAFVPTVVNFQPTKRIQFRNPLKFGGSILVFDRRNGFHFPGFVYASGSGNFASHGVAFNWWWVVFISGIPLIKPTYLKWKNRNCQAAGLCPHCGYDLRATPDRCPECGRAPVEDEA